MKWWYVLHGLEVSRTGKNEFVEGFLLNRMVKQEACKCEDIANTIRNLVGRAWVGH